MPIDLSKGHPLFDKAEAAKVSIQKAGLTGVTAAVYLVCDFSGSMRGYYRDGTMQDLTERILGLSSRFDDDGIVPVILFDTSARRPVEVHVNNATGAMASIVQAAGHMGGTDYAPAMQAVRDLHRKNGNGQPGLVVFQTDGATESRSAAEKQVRDSVREPIYWQFVGYGWEENPFLEKLDELRGRDLDNTGYFHAGNDPRNIPDQTLYDRLLGEFSAWVPQYQAKFGSFQPQRRGLFRR